MYFVVNENIVPLNCRGGFVTFGAPKVTKSACQQKGFFAAPGLPCKINQNHGLQNVAPTSPAGRQVRSNPSPRQLLLCSFLRSNHHCFV
jgi:hypothetical protein